MYIDSLIIRIKIYDDLKLFFAAFIIIAMGKKSCVGMT